MVEIRSDRKRPMAWMQVIGTSTIVSVALALSNHSTKVNIYNSQATSALYKLSDVPSLDGIGVTSILSENTRVAKSEGKGGGSKTKTIYVGTKRGKLKEVQVKWSDSDSFCTGAATDEITVEDLQDTNGNILKPYPIFSMMHVGTNSHVPVSASDDGSTRIGACILTGGGDRYITVWENYMEDMDISSVISQPSDNEVNENSNNWRWRVKAQLGPHTGWVKDLAYAYSSYSAMNESILFSIGCNCIEVWKYEGKDLQHFRKLVIESSVEMGSTLSSDLLCLTTFKYEDGEDGEDGKRRRAGDRTLSYLFAGGVDGRLHRWGLHEPFAQSGVVSAHNGRVNGITICNELKVLVSIGNDSTIQIREISREPFESWDVSSLDLVKERIKGRDCKIPEPSVKITSICIVLEDCQKAVVALGTSCGIVLLVEIVRSGTNMIMTLLKNYLTEIEHVGVILALHCDQSARSTRGDDNEIYNINIGHANGLSIWEVSFPLISISRRILLD